jgi:hypothetical protein
MLRFIEGFEHCGLGATQAQLVERLQTKWTALTKSSSDFTTELGYGDWGICLKSNADPETGLTKILDAQDTWIVGLAYKTPAAAGDASGPILNIRYKNQAGYNVDQANLYWYHTDKKIRVYVNNGTLVHTTAALSSATWYYLELKVVFHTATGSWELVINDVSSGSGSGVPTGVVNYAESLTLRSDAGGAFDDIYVLDGQAGANAFLGRCKVFTHNPVEDAGTNEWTPTPSGDHYAAVDESPTSLTDYLSTNTNGNKEVFNFEDAVHAGTIHGVQAVGQFFVPDGAFKQARVFCDSNGSTDSNSYYIASADVPSSVISISETDPDTGNAWTNSILNDATFGAEKVG